MTKHTTWKVSAAVVLGVLACAAATAAAQTKTYWWFGEIVSVDESAKTITVKAPYREPLGPFLNEYKPGDKIRLTWAMNAAGETDGILLVARFDETKYLDYGRVLPAEFVAVDKDARMLTFKTRVADNRLARLKNVPAGKWVKVTSPLEQPNDVAAIASVDPFDPSAVKKSP